MKNPLFSILIPCYNFRKIFKRMYSISIESKFFELWSYLRKIRRTIRRTIRRINRFCE